MHSRSVLLKKELMNPLLLIIRKVHLSSVNKGKLPLKLQLFRWLYKRNSILRLSPAAGIPKDHQNVMKGSFRQEEPFPPNPMETAVQPKQEAQHLVYQKPCSPGVLKTIVKQQVPETNRF